MNAILTSRWMASVLAGILGLAIGVGQANAWYDGTVLDNFSVTTATAPTSYTPLPASSGPSWAAAAPNGWAIEFQPALPLSSPATVSATFTDAGLTLAGIAGSTRTSTLTATGVSSAINNANMAMVTGTPGVFGMSLGGLTKGELTLSYTLGSPLTNVVGVGVPVGVMDHPTSVTLSVNGGPAMTDDPSGPGYLDFSFALTNINTLTFQFSDETVAALQLQVDGPITYDPGPGPTVPEPSSMAIWALTGVLGGLGLLLVCRKR